MWSRTTHLLPLELLALLASSSLPSCSAPGLLVYQGTGHSYRLSKLTPNQPYRLRVAAASEAGEGPWGPPVTFTTLPSLPDAPLGEGRIVHCMGGQTGPTRTPFLFRVHRALRSLACCVLVATVAGETGGGQVSL